MTELCEKPEQVQNGTLVVYSRSLDGGATLVVRGAEVSNDIRVALSAGRLRRQRLEGADPAGQRDRLRRRRRRRRDLPGRRGLHPGRRRPRQRPVTAIDGSVPASTEVRLEGEPAPTKSTAANGNDIIEAGDDTDPDLLEGGAGDDALVGARTDLPIPYSSGKSTLVGGEGTDVMVGGDPCDGDVFDGGPGNDNANFFRFTPGVTAQIGGPVTRDGGSCTPGRIDGSVEAIEGSPGPDTLIGSENGDSLFGKGGDDSLFGRGGNDLLSGGPGNDRLVGGPGQDSEVQ